MSAPAGPLPIVYADESSNSGQNLLGLNQPVFTVAGIHLPDDTAATIVDEVRAQLPRNQGEPKYSSLARSSGGRKALVKAFEQLPEGSTRSTLADKRFMVMTKMVDFLIEPMAYNGDLNLYEGGAAKALAEMLHIGGPVIGDAAAYQKLQQTFVDWIRQRASTDDLCSAITALQDSVPPQHAEFAEWLDLLRLSRYFGDEAASEIAAGGHLDTLDPAITSTYVLCVKFREALGDFRLVHDASKVIDRHAATLSAVHLLPDPARPGKNNRQAAVEIDFADSKNHPQLQIADWVAGAVRQWATHLAVGGGERFAQELDPVVRPWVVNAVWPTNLGS